MRVRSNFKFKSPYESHVDEDTRSEILNPISLGDKKMVKMRSLRDQASIYMPSVKSSNTTTNSSLNTSYSTQPANRTKILQK